MRTFLMMTLFVSLLGLAGCDGGPTPASDSGLPPGDAGPGNDAGPGSDAGPGNDAGTMMGTGTSPTGPRVSATCVDGRYSEVLPDSSVDISDLTGSYSAGNVSTFVDQVLARRYPLGRQLVMEGVASGRDCINLFLFDTSSAAAVIQQLDTVVHECGHMADGARGRGASSEYVVNSTLVLTASQGDTTMRGGLTFERSRIVHDSYQSLRMPCGGTFGPDCDSYADTYLDGNPDDATFEGGDQGFNYLFEELNQYVNSLAVGFAFTDVFMVGGRRISERDGLLTFLWYTERYLRMARMDYPSAYEHLLNGDSGRWRRAILTVWGRAWLYLEQTAGMSHLGIRDTLLEGFVNDPDLLDEIARLRTAEGC